MDLSPTFDALSLASPAGDQSVTSHSDLCTSLASLVFGDDDDDTKLEPEIYDVGYAADSETEQ